MSHHPLPNEHGPFRADQLREGDRYELSNGHPIYCAPSGREHSGRNLSGAAAIDTDPNVEWAGVDAGFTPTADTLRAPDIAVAAPGNERGWIPGVPPLAVEYSGPGQDEQELEEKIAELLAHGTELVWVVRLLGPRRVEVRRGGQPPRVLGPGELLTAPGILRNPLPVEALYDRDASHAVVLRNLLQRAGYDSIDAIRAAGRSEGIEQGIEQGVERGVEQGMAASIFALLTDRGLTMTEPQRERIQSCHDRDQLQRWLLAATRAEDPAELFEAGA